VTEGIKLRQAVFGCGLASILISLLAIAGAYLRHVDTSDYLKQADEAVPWIRVGFGAAFLGFGLSFFGRKRARVAAVIVGLLFMAFWFLIAASTY